MWNNWSPLWLCFTDAEKMQKRNGLKGELPGSTGIGGITIPGSAQGTRVSAGLGSAGFTVGLSGLRGLFQPKRFHDSKVNQTTLAGPRFRCNTYFPSYYPQTSFNLCFAPKFPTTTTKYSPSIFIITPPKMGESLCSQILKTSLLPTDCSRIKI